MPFTPYTPGANPQQPDASSGGGFTPFGSQQNQQTPKSQAPAAMSASSHILSAIANFGIGAGKSALNTLTNIGSAGESALDETLGRGINMVTGHGNTPTDSGSQAREFAQKNYTPEGTAQKVGAMGEQAAEFFAPGTAPEKTAVAAKDALEVANPIVKNVAAYLTKNAATGAQVAAQTTAQTGNAKEGVDAGIIATALGLPIDGAVKAFQASAGAYAPRVINSLIKPLLKDFSYGKNPGRAIAQEGITANSLDDLATKIGEVQTSYGKKIGDLAVKIGDGVKGDAEAAFKHIDDAIEKAKEAPRSNATVIQRLQDLKDDLLGRVDTVTGKDENGKDIVQTSYSTKVKDLVYNDMHALKKKVGDLTKFTGNASDDKFVNSTLKKVYGALKGGMNDMADKAGFGKEAKFLNERYADLTSAKVATEYRDKIAERQNLISMGARHTFGVSGVIAALATGGAALPAVLAGVAGSALDKTLSTTAAKTRISKWLAGVSKDDAERIFKESPQFRDALVRAGYTAKGEVGKLLTETPTQDPSAPNSQQ